MAAGLAGGAWQDATERGDAGWAVLFAGFTIGSVGVYFGLQWRELRE